MAPIIHVLLLNLVILWSEATESEKHVRDQGPENAWEKKLYQDLKVGYKPSTTPPSNKSDPFTVHVRFVLRNFRFDYQEEVFSIYAWMFISWKDERLKWDPAKYGGLKKTEFTSVKFWSPNFKLYNSANVYDFERFFYTVCDLSSNGGMLCIPRRTHETKCSAKLRNWPYDRQKCSVIYGAYDTHGRVNLSFNQRAVSMIGAEYGAEWMIVDYEQIENQNSDKQLEMIFTIEREAETLAALLIYPSYLLIALTLATLWLDVRCDVRLHLVCFSLFCHYYFVSELGANIPKESIDSPTIILYYRASEILTAIALLLTMSLRVLCKKVSQPYKLINPINDVVYNSYARLLIYPKWECENVRIDRLGEDDFSEDWMKFSNIVNSASIIIFIIVYMCLYLVYMPQPYPKIY